MKVGCQTSQNIQDGTIEIFYWECVIFLKTRENRLQRQFRDHQGFLLAFKRGQDIPWVSRDQKTSHPKQWEPMGEWLLLFRFQRIKLPIGAEGKLRTWRRRGHHRDPTRATPNRAEGKRLKLPGNPKPKEPQEYHSSLEQLLYGLHPEK